MTHRLKTTGLMQFLALVTSVYNTGKQKKTFFELFQIRELILNVLKLLNSQMNSVSLCHIKIFCNIRIFLQKYDPNSIVNPFK